MPRGLEIDRDDERLPDATRARVESRARVEPVAREAARVPERPFEPRDPNRRSATIPSHHFDLPRGPDREAVSGRHRDVRVRGTESEALVAVGSFRVVFERDLVEGTYHGDASRLAEDVRHLRARGLVDRRTIPADQEGHSVGVVTLTDSGRSLLEAHRVERDLAVGQTIYSGWRKPAELIHDASLFRMYQVEAAAIEDAGGRIERVILDDELKGDIYRMANRQHCETEDERTGALAEAARVFHVPVIDGHLELPDVRIEYETPGGARTRVDLELVTSDYHHGHVAGKQAAGFTLYSAAGSASRGVHPLGGGRRGTPGHEHLISDLLSL